MTGKRKYIQNGQNWVVLGQETNKNNFSMFWYILLLFLINTGEYLGYVESILWYLYYFIWFVEKFQIIILPYAFKMRRDYLSTSYLDQKYLPSERSETREIWIDPSNVCWDNLSLILMAYGDIFLIPFTILQMKSDQNVVNSSILFIFPCHSPWQINQ